MKIRLLLITLISLIPHLSLAQESEIFYGDKETVTCENIDGEISCKCHETIFLDIDLDKFCNETKYSKPYGNKTCKCDNGSRGKLRHVGYKAGSPSEKGSCFELYRCTKTLLGNFFYKSNKY